MLVLAPESGLVHPSSSPPSNSPLWHWPRSGFSSLPTTPQFRSSSLLHLSLPLNLPNLSPLLQVPLLPLLPLLLPPLLSQLPRLRNKRTPKSKHSKTRSRLSQTRTTPSLNVSWLSRRSRRPSSNNWPRFSTKSVLASPSLQSPRLPLPLSPGLLTLLPSNHLHAFSAAPPPLHLSALLQTPNKASLPTRLTSR